MRWCLVDCRRLPVVLYNQAQQGPQLTVQFPSQSQFFINIFIHSQTLPGQWQTALQFANQSPMSVKYILPVRNKGWCIQCRVHQLQVTCSMDVARPSLLYCCPAPYTSRVRNKQTWVHSKGQSASMSKALGLMDACISVPEFLFATRLSGSI